MKKELFASFLALSLAMAGGCTSDHQNSQDKSDQKTTESSNENTKTDPASGSKDEASDDRAEDSADDQNSASDSEESSNPGKGSQTDENAGSQTQSETASSQTSSSEQSGSAASSSESSATGSDQNQTSASTDSQGQNDQNASTAQLMSSSIASKLAQAISDQGYPCSEIEYEISDTGNSVASFSAGAGPDASLIFVTSSVSADMAQKTFDANCANDEAQNMQIMNEWTDNGNIVRVIRNNMANANYVEVFDQYQSSTIHIANTLPEQLDVILAALQNIGYPVS